MKKIANIISWAVVSATATYVGIVIWHIPIYQFIVIFGMGIISGMWTASHWEE